MKTVVFFLAPFKTYYILDKHFQESVIWNTLLSLKREITLGAKKKRRKIRQTLKSIKTISKHNLTRQKIRQTLKSIKTISKHNLTRRRMCQCLYKFYARQSALVKDGSLPTIDRHGFNDYTQHCISPSPSPFRNSWPWVLPTRHLSSADR